MKRRRLLDLLRLLISSAAFASTILTAFWAAELLQVTP